MDLNFSLHPAQLKVFNSPARFKVVAAGRRFGKSYLSAVTLLIEGLKEENDYGYSLKNKEVYYVAPTFQQGKDILWNLLKDLGKDVIDRTIENTGTIHLINGRTIRIKGSDRPDTLRGIGLSYVVLDEYAFMKPDVWEDILFPTLADVKGSALFIGTPDGKNHFFDVYQEAEKYDDWAAWHFNSIDNPILDSELIDRARDKMSAHSFKQEFEASFSASGGGIFKQEMLVYSTEEPKDGEYYIAVDPHGFGDTKGLTKSRVEKMDEMAIAIVKVGTYGWWVKEIDSGRWGIRESALKILRHAQKVQASKIGIEKGALKNALDPYLNDTMGKLGFYRKMIPLTHGGTKKTDRIAWALQGRFEHKKIVLNKGEWNRKFEDQLLDIPNPLSHDDLPDALAYIDQIAKVNYAGDSLEIEEWAPLDLIAGI